MAKSVRYLSAPPQPGEALYQRVRDREGRHYTDAEVRRLPDLPAPHPLAAEWRQRSATLKLLKHHFRQRSHPIRIMDFGCGCGWLTHHLAQLPHTQVWGVDVNALELEQAARVFPDAPNLTWVYADVQTAAWDEAPFDDIVLASVIQYFADLPTLLRRLRRWLAAEGTLHIVDSPWYAPAHLAAARARSAQYYTALGFPEMANAYHHHTLAELAPFAPRINYNPHGWAGQLQRLMGQPTPAFMWVQCA